MKMTRNKKGIAFTFDAVFALMIALAIVPIFLVLTADTAPQNISQALTMQAEDALDVMSQLKVRDVAKEPVISDLYLGGTIDETDLNLTLLELVSDLWASNSSLNATHARNITQQIFGTILPSTLKWSFSIDQERLVNASGTYDTAATAGRRVVSGFRKGAPSSGYVASAFLTSIGGKRASSYYFFGGFVGQGVVTAKLPSIPSDANMTEFYLELNAGSNFTLAMNSAPCGTYNVTVGNFTVDSWSVVGSSGTCLANASAGTENNVTLNFTGANLTDRYIGGGYLRLIYTTAELAETEGDVVSYVFPGVDGLVNLYDSFTVPGNITNMDANLTFLAGVNYTTQLVIGNVTVLNHTGTGSVVNVNISNATFAQYLAAQNVTLLDLSSATVPLRMFTLANITGGLLNGSTDVILITDTSGSMSWRLNQDGTAGTGINDCTDPAIYNPTTARISLARCLDKTFVNAILGGNTTACGIQTSVYGNRVGLVAFSSSANAWESLTTNITYLESRINTYGASGSTCIACAINRAYNILLSQSNASRQKYIVVMTDGEANIRSTSACYDFNDADANLTAGESGATASRLPPWTAANSGGASDNFNRVAVLNSTLARAAADGGEIYRWNNDVWTLEQDTGSNDVHGIDLWNSTFGFAVGESGKIWQWNGASWSETNDFGSFRFRAVAFMNSTLVYAVGDGGRIYRWGGVSWASFQTVGGGAINLYGVDGNSSLVYTVGSSGKIYRWTGGTFSEVADTGGNTHYDVAILNSSRVFTASSDGRAYQWNGATWSNTVLSSYALRGVHIANETLAYVVGDDRGDIYEWDGSSWMRTFPTFQYQGTSTTGLTCGDDDTCSFTVTDSWPALNANWSTWRAWINLTNLTVDAVGFGPIATCSFGNNTVREIARTGNGTAYSSANATELQTIYCQIAENILTRATQTQQIVTEGQVVRSQLSPQSKLTFTYVSSTPPAGYQEITLGTETDHFSGCDGSFFIAPRITLVDALRTSYSGVYWTKHMSIQDTGTGAFQVVYNLSRYGSAYSDLGDPYRVSLPVQLFTSNVTNTVRNELGLNASSASSACSSSDRVIYKARLRASVPLGSVFPSLSGGVLRIYYDTNHDGTADGFSDISIGATLPGFDPTVKTINELDIENNALHNAVVRLLDELNLVVAPGSIGRSGESTNPIDIRLDEVSINIAGTAGVPYGWGPLDVILEVGI